MINISLNVRNCTLKWPSYGNCHHKVLRYKRSLIYIYYLPFRQKYCTSPKQNLTLMAYILPMFIFMNLKFNITSKILWFCNFIDIFKIWHASWMCGHVTQLNVVWPCSIKQMPYIQHVARPLKWDAVRALKLTVIIMLFSETLFFFFDWNESFEIC